MMVKPQLAMHGVLFFPQILLISFTSVCFCDFVFSQIPMNNPIFSVTRRSRSDVSESVSEWWLADLTDVTLVNDEDDEDDEDDEANSLGTSAFSTARVAVTRGSY